LGQERKGAELKIEVLYFKQCPNHQPAIAQVRQALSFEGIDIPVEEVEVTDAARAQELGFLGSPSIRVDGLDVEPEARGLQTFGFGCRTYSDAEGHRSGLPSISIIRRALTETPSHNVVSAGTPS
jgi:hypothetical protein